MCVERESQWSVCGERESVSGVCVWRERERQWSVCGERESHLSVCVERERASVEEGASKETNEKHDTCARKSVRERVYVCVYNTHKHTCVCVCVRVRACVLFVYKYEREGFLVTKKKAL